MDFGEKRGIAEALAARGCEAWSLPHDTPAREIMKINPNGIMLSNGPGDPAEPANNGIIETIRELTRTGVPIFGICLGHQLLALANGHKTQKLKFGHRGANQPVKELSTGRVYITSQNHGYAVVADGGSFVNVNDGTCEGMDYGNSFSVQFHPEARGGPLDTAFLFDRFIERMERMERMESVEKMERVNANADR
jgi:carbamoyl-phosphate synthase small subunit